MCRVLLTASVIEKNNHLFLAPENSASQSDVTPAFDSGNKMMVLDGYRCSYFRGNISLDELGEM